MSLAINSALIFEHKPVHCRPKPSRKAGPQPCAAPGSALQSTAVIPQPKNRWTTVKLSFCVEAVTANLPCLGLKVVP